MSCRRYSVCVRKCLQLQQKKVVHVELYRVKQDFQRLRLLASLCVLILLTNNAVFVQISCISGGLYYFLTLNNSKIPPNQITHI